MSKALLISNHGSRNAEISTSWWRDEKKLALQFLLDPHGRSLRGKVVGARNIYPSFFEYLPILCCLCYLLFNPPARASFPDPIMPAERQDPGWPYVGKPGGIPAPAGGTNIINVKSYGAYGDGLHDDSIAVSNAAAFACGQATNHNLTELYFPSGEYLLTQVNTSGGTASALQIPGGFPTLYPQVDVIGDGPGLSTIYFSNNTAQCDVLLFRTATSVSTNYYPITSGNYQGSTSFTVTSTNSNFPTPGYNPGDVISITQANDPAFVNTNTLNSSSPYTNGAPCVYCGENGQNVCQEYVTVTSCAGGTVNFSPPIFFNWETAYNAHVQKVVFNTNCGVRNLTVTRYPWHVQSDNGYNIDFFNMQGCWVSNVESSYSLGAHIRLYQSYHCRVVYNYIHDGPYTQSGENYAVWLFGHSSGHLIDNNIFNNVRHFVVTEGGGADSVVAANFETNCIVGANPTDFLSSGDLQHGAHGWFIDYEGNKTVDLRGDFYHGSSSDITYLREFVSGRSYVYAGQPDATNYIGNPNQTGTYVTNHGGYSQIFFSYFNRSNSVIGSVLSTNLFLETNTTTGPAIFTNSPSGGFVNQDEPMVLTAGYSDVVPTEGASLAPIDNVAMQSVYFHGNWVGISNNVFWVSGNSDRAIPSSFYLAAPDAIYNAYSTYMTQWPEIGSDLSPMTSPLPAEVRFNDILASGNVNWQPQSQISWPYFLMNH